MAVVLSCRVAHGAPWERYVCRRGAQVLCALTRSRAELSLSLVGDAEMRTLNRAYRGRDRTTDVLAFPQDALAGRMLGDVVISLDTAAAQARASRVALATRLDELLIHGVLHLVGYDHEVSAAEARRMAARARQVRAALAACARPPHPGRRSTNDRKPSGRRTQGRGPHGKPRRSDERRRRRDRRRGRRGAGGVR